MTTINLIMKVTKTRTLKKAAALVIKKLKKTSSLDTNNIEELIKLISALSFENQELSTSVQQLEYDLEEATADAERTQSEFENRLLQNREVCDEIAEKVNVYNFPLTEVVEDKLLEHGFVLRKTA